jgi:hypothetical protein
MEKKIFFARNIDSYIPLFMMEPKSKEIGSSFRQHLLRDD